VTRRSALKLVLALALVAIVGCIAVFAWMKFAPRHVPPGQPPLATLGAESVPAFRDAFNAGNGEVRVLAMLSPT
jgi:hypothetical protein